jgi:hypothetical protein
VADAVVDRAARGEHDDGDVPRAVVTAERLEGLAAAHPGHGEVEKDEVGGVAPGGAHRLLAAGRHGVPVPVQLEERGHDVPHVGIVVDHQGPWSARGELQLLRHAFDCAVCLAR